MEEREDRRDLKIRALKDSLANTVVQYEDKIADMRIVITEQEEAFNRVVNQLNETNEQLAQQQVTPQEIVEDPKDVLEKTEDSDSTES
jgi:hypothetical protein